MAGRSRVWILAVAAAWLPLSAVPALADSQQKGWIFRQNNGYVPGTGVQTVTVTATDVKAVSSEFTIYSKGAGHPLWIYSDTSREYMEQSYEDWMKKFGAKDPKLTGKQLVKCGSGSLLGLKVTKYLRYVQRTHGGNGPSKEFWLTKDV